MRADRLPRIAAVPLLVAALAGCAPTTSPPAGSTLVVTGADGVRHPIAATDLQCVTASGKFTASTTARVQDLPALVATTTDATRRSSTWVSLGDGAWFLTTEAFAHDGAVTFDHAKGRIGTSSGGYPTQLEQSGAIDGSLPCTTQKTL